MNVTSNICPKCSGEDFSEWVAFGANFRRCKKCNFAERLNSSIEYENYIRELQKAKQSPTVTCPYCQSTDTKKISGTSRFMSTGIFGLASKKIGKNFHCNKCKSDF